MYSIIWSFILHPSLSFGLLNSSPTLSVKLQSASGIHRAAVCWQNVRATPHHSADVGSNCVRPVDTDSEWSDVETRRVTEFQRRPGAAQKPASPSTSAEKRKRIAHRHVKYSLTRLLWNQRRQILSANGEMVYCYNCEEKGISSGRFKRGNGDTASMDWPQKFFSKSLFSV